MTVMADLYRKTAAQLAQGGGPELAARVRELLEALALTGELPPALGPAERVALAKAGVVPYKNPLAAAALAYARRGLPVFPCQARGKAPLVAGGFKAATADPDRVRAWWRENPQANIAIPTGAATGLVVLDVDPRAGGREALKRLEALGLPATLTVITGGGGVHLYFRHPGGHIPSRPVPGYAGLDVKADGGYVLVPPSRHPSGGLYLWLDPQPDFAQLAALGPLEALCRGPEAPRPAEPVGELETIPQGRRNVTLTSFAGALRRLGASREALEAALLAINEAVCRPPLPAREVREIARKVSTRYSPAERPAPGEVKARGQRFTFITRKGGRHGTG